MQYKTDISPLNPNPDVIVTLDYIQVLQMLSQMGRTISLKSI